MSKFELQLDGEQKDPRLENLSVEEYKKDPALMSNVVYSEEENKQIDDFSKKINLYDSNIILQYGAGCQRKITEFSEKTLESVKSQDLGEVGKLLNDVVFELKHFNDEEVKGIRGFFKKQTDKLDLMSIRFQSAEKNIDSIVKSLENHQITLIKDISMLDKLYELNEDYYKELSMYIEAGNRKLKNTYEHELKDLKQKALSTNLPEDAQKVNDLMGMINRFEKKLHDLSLSRTVVLQLAPQIRMVQASNTIMAEKIQTTLANTIPLWKNQMVLALGISHSQQAIAAQDKINEMTNKLLRHNADQLKINTIETAKASEKGIVEIDTIRHTNEQLISAIEEVRNIQIEGKKKREEAKKELLSLEQRLKESLRR